MFFKKKFMFVCCYIKLFAYIAKLMLALSLIRRSMLALFLKSNFVVMLKRFRLVNALMLLLGGSFYVNVPLFAESLTGIGQQQENCNGVVKDATGETVIGASIIVKGTTNGTVTDLAYIIHSGFISGYQNRYGDNLKPPTNVYHRMTA